MNDRIGLNRDSAETEVSARSTEASAETSAEASVKMAEASVSAESRFRPIRSFTMPKDTLMHYHIHLIFNFKLYVHT